MQGQDLLKYKKSKMKVKLNLKNNLFFTGEIIDVTEDTILFRDKYDDEILIQIDSISYVAPISQ